MRRRGSPAASTWRRPMRPCACRPHVRAVICGVRVARVETCSRCACVCVRRIVRRTCVGAVHRGVRCLIYCNTGHPCHPCPRTSPYSRGALCCTTQVLLQCDARVHTECLAHLGPVTHGVRIGENARSQVERANGLLQHLLRCNARQATPQRRNLAKRVLYGYARAAHEMVKSEFRGRGGHPVRLQELDPNREGQVTVPLQGVTRAQ